MSAEPEDAADPTEGGRWIVVDGRRWRASDPAIPDALRQELVNELMAARRGVGAARRADDDSAERDARDRVQDAKVALGERGDRWWEPPTDDGQRERVRAAIRALTGHRAPDRTICPSDVARSIGGSGWRGLMTQVREEARSLAHRGVVEVTQRGSVLDPATAWKGPIRIRRIT